MRFPKKVLLFMPVVALLNSGSHQLLTAEDETSPIQDIFDDRALKVHERPPSGPDPTIVAALQNSAIGQAYNAIRPERSVLAFDCGRGSAWCGNRDFSFQSIFTESAKLANMPRPDPDQVAVAWYTSASKLDNLLDAEGARFAKLKDAPFQLLAIANRMDLASFDKDKDQWTGAEMHFVYGLIPAAGAGIPQDLMVIMEFVLPTFTRPDFKGLAQTWVALSKATDEQYSDALLKALRTSGLYLNDPSPTRAIAVRSRINHAVGPARWQLSQLVLDPTSFDPAARTQFTPSKLTDQLSQNLSPNSRLYLRLWQGAQKIVESGSLQFKIPDELLEGPSVRYNVADGHQGLGTPTGLCNPSETVRSVLGLQQCTLCHTTETGVQFAQIPNRLPKDASVPSGFLVGKSRVIHPSLVDLYYGTESDIWSVDINYQSYVDPIRGLCETPKASEVKRKFHDVARRALFLAATSTDSLVQAKEPPAGQFSTFFTE